MLRNAKDLKGFKLGARDGELGRVKEFCFDDASWFIRYLMADTGTWMAGRQVLISPHAIRQIHPAPKKVVELTLSKQQVEASPSIETNMPVSRQFELEYYQHYNWPVYWGGPWDWGPVPFPGAPGIGFDPNRQPSPGAEYRGDPHLRSTGEVLHYSIQARDDIFGQVTDFIIDDEAWAIRYLVADTRHWLPGRKVLLPPQWITSVSWSEARVHVDLDRDTVKHAPEHDPSAPLTREYETRLFGYYGRQPYWERRAAAAA